MSLFHRSPAKKNKVSAAFGTVSLRSLPLVVTAIPWTRLWLDQTHPWSLAEPVQRPALRAFWFDGLFLALGLAFVNTYVPLYALGMGATASQIGLLASVPGATAVVGSLWGSQFARRLHSNKKAGWLGNRVLDQVIILIFALLPWLVPSSLAIFALILTVGSRAFLNNIGSPGWAALAAAVTPEHLRGRYFSSRQMIKLVSTLVGVPLAGFLIARAGGYPAGFQLSFGIALVLLMGSTYWFSRIPEPEGSRPASVAPVAAAPWWQAKNFTRFAAATFLLTLAGGVANPFYPVYMTRTLGLDAEAIGLLTTITTACQFLSLPFLGTLHDRRGSRWLTGVVTLLAVPLPWAWLLVSSAWHLVPIQAIGGFTQAGLNLGVFNLMLRCVPATNDLTRYTSGYYMVAAGAGVVAPLLGGVLFEKFSLAGTVVISGFLTLAAAMMYFFLVKEKTPSPA